MTLEQWKFLFGCYASLKIELFYSIEVFGRCGSWEAEKTGKTKGWKNKGFLFEEQTKNVIIFMFCFSVDIGQLHPHDGSTQFFRHTYQAILLHVIQFFLLPISKQWLNQHYYKIKSGMPQIKKHEYILFCFFS